MMGAVFHGTARWPVGVEIIDVEVANDVVHLYHEWTLEEVCITAVEVRLIFRRYKGGSDRMATLSFGEIEDISLVTDTSQFPPGTPSDGWTFAAAFHDLHHVITTQEWPVKSEFEIHFSDKKLTLISGSVSTSWGRLQS